MAGSSDALDVSTLRDDLKRIHPSSVNISNFVSVTLSGRSDYNIWKAQMLCLLESLALIHVIDAGCPSPEEEDFDSIVKDWILGTVLEDIVEEYVGNMGTARELWMKLESLFNPPISNDEGWSTIIRTRFKGSPTYIGDPTRTRVSEYKSALQLNVSDFVTLRLSGYSNYSIWKAQMLCLIESQELLHIINSEYPFPEDKGVHMIPQYGIVVKGWILTTINKKLLKCFVEYSSARSIWRKLESMFNRSISDREGDSIDISALREDLKYIQVSNVNVSNFVSVKLTGLSNYKIWKHQMLCLVKSQELLHIIEGRTRNLETGGPMTEKYDNLVKGWIYGAMNDQLLKDFITSSLVQSLWRDLDSMFNVSPGPDQGEEDSVGLMFGIEYESDVPEMENTESIRQKKKLYEAAIEGRWWKAKSVLKVHKNAAKEPITSNGNTILHLAVELGNDYFLEKLLEFLKDGKDTETQNDKGRTALHIAAMIGNSYAVQLLVQKRKELLEIKDKYAKSPLDISYANRKLNISTYLLKIAQPSNLNSDSSSYLDEYLERVLPAIQTAIYTKQYDLATELLTKFPTSDFQMTGALMSLTVTFPSDLGFMESFIYPSFNNVRKKIVLRGSLLFQYNIFDNCVDDILWVMKICNTTCCGWLDKISMTLLVPIATLYPIYQLISLLFLLLSLTFSMCYFLLWKVLLVIVRPIKNIEKKKKEYQEAKKFLRFIINYMGTTEDYDYREPILEAVRQDTYEVVDEILFKSPETINCNKEGHDIIQLAVINRSEKVYNLIHHIIERRETSKTMTDYSGNNLVHLAARLAPSAVLSRTTGAALQLQRELIWYEEVKKLMFPLELLNENFDKETPAMVFTREHQDLMKQGEAWMKTTAESCSITAALIVTIIFAAAITVPGGSNQESGIPVFKKEIAFTVFAVFNAFSLFTATTALLLFLSILTTRFSERDFLDSLPRRLSFGLLMLFLSTTAMIIAFCAILFLVFCDQRPWMLAPVCGLACLPISVIVTIKLPLLIDLIRLTYFPIFGKQSYLESSKVNRRNTIFTE